MPDHLFGNEGICPFFNVIVRAVALVGKTCDQLITQPEYCGSYMSLSHRAETPKGQTTMCARIALDLGQLIQTAQYAPDNPLVPNENGNVHLEICCKPKDLSRNLHKHLDHLAGLAAIIKLTQAVNTAGNNDIVRSPKKVLELATNIWNDLCRDTLGVEGVAELISVLAGIDPKGKGCQQRPKNFRPSFSER